MITENNSGKPDYLRLAEFNWQGFTVMLVKHLHRTVAISLISLMHVQRNHSIEEDI